MDWNASVIACNSIGEVLFQRWFSDLACLTIILYANVQRLIVSAWWGWSNYQSLSLDQKYESFSSFIFFG